MSTEANNPQERATITGAIKQLSDSLERLKLLKDRSQRICLGLQMNSPIDLSEERPAEKMRDPVNVAERIYVLRDEINIAIEDINGNLSYIEGILGLDN